MISCLRGAGVDVVERHVSVWEGREHKYAAGIGAGVRLARAELSLLRTVPADFDAVVVGYPGHADLLAARRVARGRPVIFNPLVSLADTLVGDRGRFRAGSFADHALRTLDRLAFRTADLVVADTAAHAELFERLGARRVDVCFVGAEERLFRPGWRTREPFTALFVGKLIPLHGIETVLEAARRAPEIRFRVIGTGQQQRVLERRPPNVEWTPWVAYEELPIAIGSCGCALGIFGTSAKAQRVIPNKVFQALACGTPVVSADTPAMRELGEGAVVRVPAGDATALAKAIQQLAADPTLRADVAAHGATAYAEHASEAILGSRWRALVEGLL